MNEKAALRRLFRGLFNVDDVLNLGAAIEAELALGPERYGSFGSRIYRVILAQGGVLAGKGIETLLADDYRAYLGFFAGIELDPEVSRV